MLQICLYTLINSCLTNPVYANQESVNVEKSSCKTHKTCVLRGSRSLRSPHAMSSPLQFAVITIPHAHTLNGSEEPCLNARAHPTLLTFDGRCCRFLAMQFCSLAVSAGNCILIHAKHKINGNTCMHAVDCS